MIHQAVQDRKSLSEIDSLLQAGGDVDDCNAHGTTALMLAAAANDTLLMWFLIQRSAKLESVDRSGRTALLHAVAADASEGVRVLLKAGANPSHRNAYGETAIQMASTPDIVRLLVEYGESISDVNPQMRRTLTGLEGDEIVQVTPAEYQGSKLRRFGCANPDLMNNPFWCEMIRTGIIAYDAQVQFEDIHSSGPVWCYHRFGSSFTELPDGRFVQIGGEHEDFYDPDFCIYNDVVVFDGSGSFHVFGYPEEVFPPTDFHSATYLDGSIYIIGGLGYEGRRRPGYTPVYGLNCTTWSIEPVETSGESPGWIYKHRASVDESGRITITGGEVAQLASGGRKHVKNSSSFTLDLERLVWCP